MSTCKLVVEARRERYSMDDIQSSMTVGQLINFLMDFDENAEVILSHDNGYTYGGIYESDFSEVYDIELKDCKED